MAEPRHPLRYRRHDLLVDWLLRPATIAALAVAVAAVVFVVVQNSRDGTVAADQPATSTTIEPAAPVPAGTAGRAPDTTPPRPAGETLTTGPAASSVAGTGAFAGLTDLQAVRSAQTLGQCALTWTAPADWDVQLDVAQIRLAGEANELDSTYLPAAVVDDLPTNAVTLEVRRYRDTTGDTTPWVAIECEAAN